MLPKGMAGVSPGQATSCLLVGEGHDGIPRRYPFPALMSLKVGGKESLRRKDFLDQAARVLFLLGPSSACAGVSGPRNKVSSLKGKKASHTRLLAMTWSPYHVL